MSIYLLKMNLLGIYKMTDATQGAEQLKNERHELFCQEYLKDLNISQAAVRAGFSERSAKQHGFDVYNREEVQERIQYLNSHRLNRVQVDADYVLQRLVEIDQMDVLDIMDDKHNLLPLTEWPKIWRQYISNFESIELSDANGAVKKIKWPDKVKNLELLGKHISVGAFKERLEHTGKDGGPIDLSLKVVFEDDGEASTK